MTRFGAALLIVSALGFGCSSTIDASNPFDPNAPADTQAKARVVGVLTAADATDGAGVTLTLSANHQVIKQTASGDDGSFVFDAVVPGQYQLDARKDGFAAISIPLTLAPGATADLGHVDLTDTAAPTQPALVLVEGDSRQNGLTHVSTVELTLSAAGKAVAAEVSEDPGLAGATTISLPTDPQHPPTLTLTGDGVHTVYARFLDAAGNASDRVSAQVIVDTVAPLSVPPGAPAVVSGTTFQLLPPPAGEDEVEITGDQVLSPTGFVPVTPNLPLSVTVAAGDGGKVLHLRYRDLADNVTTLDPITVVLDTHAPVAVKFPVIGFRANGTTSTSVLASPNVSLDFSAETDAATSIAALRVSNRSDLADATFQPFNATIPWILQAGDGPKAVYAQFRDQAGNDSAIVENDGALTLAQTPPAGATLLIDGGATVTNQRYAQSIAISSQVGQGSPPSEMWLSTTGFSGAAGGPRDTGWVPYANTWNPAGSYPGLDLSSGAATSTFSGATVVVSAKFRNLALVEGGNTSATIVIDDTPPSGGRLRLAGLDSGAGLFTNTPAVTALIDQAAGDPSSMAFAITGGAPCNTDLAFAN
ncbi:MAG: carboxypeptidase regulatory-like domain-containing protein, partial [Deltaproteobacteria bacterium]|nr:carboxypeptidase regulatory-like domain-containing protein [Deltaproteobacteria bacterium]